MMTLPVPCKSVPVGVQNKRFEVVKDGWSSRLSKRGSKVA